MCASNPSAVRVSGRPITPALLISTSTPSTESANFRTLARSARSRGVTSTRPVMPAAACSAFGMVRQAMTTLCPAAASVAAVAAPTPLLPPVTMTFTRRSSSVSRSRAVDLGEAIDLEHASVCDCCTLPTTPAGGRCRGRVQAGEICSVQGRCARSVATFTLRKQLAPNCGIRTKTETLVTRSLCASKYFSFRLLQDHPGGTLPGFGLVAYECNNQKGGLP